MDNSLAQVVLFPVQMSEFINSMRIMIREEINAANNLKPEHAATRKILNVNDAATLLNLSKSRVYVLAANGELPSYRNKKKLYFFQDELMSLIESGRRQTQADVDNAADEALLKKYTV